MQSTVKLLVYLAAWRRPEITEICFMGLNRLRKVPGYDINVLAVISEESMISLCEQYDINWVMHENKPLGRKKNFGLKHARNFDFDFMMEIGSDDLVLDDLLYQYPKFIAKYDFVGIRDLAYVDSETLECRRLQSTNTTYGAGRMISRRALERADFTLWKDKQDCGLDNYSLRKLYGYGFKYWQIPPVDYPLVIDIKSAENIWAFNHLKGVRYDVENVLSRISEPEVNKLLCLSQKYKLANLTDAL